MSDQELIEFVASKKVTPEELQTVVDITSHPISSIVGALLSSRFNIDLAVESLLNASPSDLVELSSFAFQKLEERKSQKDKDNESEGDDDDDDDDGDESDDYDGPFYKMVIGARVDLGLSPGKLAAQVAHAAVDLYKAMLSDHRPLLDAWENVSGCKKVVVRVKDEASLRELYRKASSMGLPATIIKDAGHTEVSPGTATVFAVAGKEEDVNEVTGRLPLY